LVDVESALKDKTVRLEQRLLAQWCPSFESLLVRGPAPVLAPVAEGPRAPSDTERALTELRTATEVLDRTTRRILRFMEDERERSNIPAWKLVWMAKRYSEDGAVGQAVRMYGRALDLEHDQVGWRLSLAMLLADQGKIAEAIDELNICLRSQPHSDVAWQLHRRLTLEMAAGAGDL
jgi:predicted Zn-dependent protease